MRRVDNYTNQLTPEIYSDWLRAQGGRVVRTESSYWHAAGVGVFQAFPYHWEIEPGRKDFGELFYLHRAAAIRYSAPAGSPSGIESYHVVRGAGPYDLDSLGHWARKNVRRGLKNCVVEPVPVERFIAEGWVLRTDSLDRQGRDTGETFEKWRQRLLHAAQIEGFEFWGAFVQEKLGAILLTFRMSECVTLILQQCDRRFLKEHVNNALSFEVTRHMLARPGVESIFYGLESLDAPRSVDEFKFRMGYRARPVRQCVVFNPLVAPLMNRLTYAALKALVRQYPSNRTFSKTAGLIRVYLEGGKS
jgi:hypothetical protein